MFAIEIIREDLLTVHCIPSRGAAHSTVDQYARLTKSRKVWAKNCGQIVANRVRELACDFAIAGCALPLDAPFLSVSPGHRGWIPYWSPLAAALSQPRSHLDRFLGSQTHQRLALSLGVKASAQPRSHLERL